MPDERLGQAIVLVAVAKGDGAEERLRAYLRRELPPHMQPPRIVWSDELPVGPNGKLDRTALQGGTGMKALGPIPPGFEADDEGRLLIGGWNVEELVGEAGGTPLFVYDSRRIADQVARFRAAFPSEVALHYAVKANPYAPLLEAMASMVDGFDVASAGELGRVAHLGLPISFAGPGKRDAGAGNRDPRRHHDQPRKRRRGGAGARHRRARSA